MMEPMGPDDQFINAVKAAELLRIGYKTMLRWIKAGRVRALERRYDYENAEFLIPLEEIERLRAALNMSQRELVTRFLKLELDAQSLAVRLIQAEGQIRALGSELAQFQIQFSLHLSELHHISEEEGDTSGGADTPAAILRPFDLALSVTPDLTDELPPGSVRLTAFFRDHSIPITTGLDHLVKTDIEPILLDRGARDRSKGRWLSPDLQARLVIFWDSAGKPYTPCPDCPHYATTESHEASELTDQEQRPEAAEDDHES